MSESNWFRVMYGPPDAPKPYRGFYRYGWVFCSPSMGHAWDTLRRTCNDWRTRPYDIAQVFNTDFDNPENMNPAAVKMQSSKEPARC